MFAIFGMASAFLFGRKPEVLGAEKDKNNACDAPASEPSAKESIGNKEKQDRNPINEYYMLSKKKRYALEELLPLSALQEGQKGKIIIAVGDRKLISRLCDLGLIPETQFRVLKKGLMEGPIILEVRSCELAIGREVASKVLVKPF
ncbi:MAG: FeoA family protein [Candidatus Methanosuratincola sp.]